MKMLYTCDSASVITLYHSAIYRAFYIWGSVKLSFFHKKTKNIVVLRKKDILYCPSHTNKKHNSVSTTQTQ